MQVYPAHFPNSVRRIKLASKFGIMMQKIAAALCCVLLVQVFEASAVALGGNCDANSDCTTTNAYCHFKSSTCGKGECMCKSGYTGSACGASKTYNEACSGTDVCGTGLSCQSSVCACVSGTWNTMVKACVASTQYLIGATTTTCGTAGVNSANCYSNGSPTGSYECAGTPTTYCKCVSGYIMDSGSYKCRLPKPQETCTTAVGCDTTILNGDTVSFKSPTCTGSPLTCTCPSGSAVQNFEYMTMTSKVCYVSSSSTVSIGQTCTTQNQCTLGSALCMTCPESGTTKKCLDISGAGTITASVAVMVMACLVSILN